MYKAKFAPKGDVAVKIIDKRVDSEYIDHFMQRELDIIVRLSHPNIVAVYAVIYLQH